MECDERDKEIACQECGNIHDKEDLTYITGNWYCEDCITTCEDCQESMIYGSEFCIDDYIYCQECFDDNIFTCDWCSNVEHNDNRNTDENSGEICHNCIEQAFICADCGNFTGIDYAFCNDDECYCEDCFNESFSYCIECDEIMNRDDINGDGYCQWCYQDHDHGIIQDYMFKPEPIFYGKSNLYMGIEIEVERIEGFKEHKDMAEELEHDSLYFKQDSSLDEGFEIVTHPMSYQHIKTNWEFFNNMFKSLLEEGYRSYNTNTCGIHIHLSKRAFSTIHLYKFLKMFYDSNHFDFIKTISQRAESNGHCQWGNREYIDKSEVIDKAKKKRGGNRYTAVNLNNRDTIEIRIFRGTLKTESFFKNIEFIMAVYNYTLDCSIKDATPARLIKYISNNRKSYKNLHAFIEKNIKS